MITGYFSEEENAFIIAKFLRHQVFTLEQGFPNEMESDPLDSMATFAILMVDDIPVGSARLAFMSPVLAIISYLCILPNHRNKGFGDMLMRMLLDKAIRSGAQQVVLTSQENLLPYYFRYGFKTIAGPYQRANMNHYHLAVSAMDIRIPRACKHPKE